MFRMMAILAAGLIPFAAHADDACSRGSAIGAIAAMSVPGMPDEIADGIGDRTPAEIEELVGTFGRRTVGKALDRRHAKLLVMLDEVYSNIVEAVGFYCPCGKIEQTERMTVYGMARRITCTTQETDENLVYVVILSDRSTIVIPQDGSAPIVVHKTPPTNSESD